MLKIRLKRVGKKGDSAFRIIVTEAGKSITSGDYIDQVGFYDPRLNKKEIDTDKAAKWLSDGAQPSDTVYNLLIDAGVIEGRKKNVLPQKSAVVTEGEESSPEVAQTGDEPAEVADEAAAETENTDEQPEESSESTEESEE